MPIEANDTRSSTRRNLDEQIAGEPMLPPPDLPADATPTAIEDFPGHRRRPLAVPGVVENGLIRPLDPSVHLVERSRVIIVAAEG